MAIAARQQLQRNLGRGHFDFPRKKVPRVGRRVLHEYRGHMLGLSFLSDQCPDALGIHDRALMTLAQLQELPGDSATLATPNARVHGRMCLLHDNPMNAQDAGAFT